MNDTDPKYVTPHQRLMISLASTLAVNGFT